MIAQTQTASQTQLDQLCINTIRPLLMNAVQQANSGHPGTSISRSTSLASRLIKWLQPQKLNWQADVTSISCKQESHSMNLLVPVNGVRYQTLAPVPQYSASQYSSQCSLQNTVNQSQTNNLVLIFLFLIIGFLARSSSLVLLEI